MKRFRLFAAALALALALPLSAHAAEAGAATPSYDEVFKVPQSAISAITNNAGHYGRSVIQNAVDGNSATHWETNTPNRTNFLNKVTITLSESYELDRLNYLVRQDGARPKGFPLSYRLYYSTEATGDSFQLLKEGSFAQSSGSAVDITFAPTAMRRFQLEFVQAQGDWASAAELSLYKPDPLREEMAGLFTDNTFSALN